VNLVGCIISRFVCGLRGAILPVACTALPPFVAGLHQFGCPAEKRKKKLTFFV